MPQNPHYVYILASETRTLYIGMTRDLDYRISEHFLGLGSKFAAKYRTTKVVYVETYPSFWDAVARETQLKKWRREKKVALIEKMNPAWQDLSRTLWPDSSIKSE